MSKPRVGHQIRSAVGSMKDALRDGDMPWELFAVACRQLLDAADKVDAMERRPVPAALRAKGAADADAPVVDLRAYRARCRPRPTLAAIGPTDEGPAA